MEEHIARIHKQTKLILNQAKNPQKSQDSQEKQKLIMNWAFTLNNPEMGIDDKTFEAYFKEHAIRAFFELEEGESKTPHFQGYFILKKRKQLKNLKRNLSDKAHFEEMKSNELANFKYCTKDLFEKKTNFYIAVGNFDNIESQQQQKSTQQSELQSAIDQYQTIDELMEQKPYIYCRYRNGLQDIYQKRQQLNTTKQPPIVIWLSGITGCGKSKEAHEIATNYATRKGRPNEKPWSNYDTLQWFDGYYQQLVAIFEDFRKDQCKFAQFLRLLDRYEMNVQVKTQKGGTFWNPELIIITCPRKPEDEFTYKDKWNDGTVTTFEDIQQVIRRLSVIKHYGEITPGITGWTFIKGKEIYDSLMQQNINSDWDETMEMINETNSHYYE